MCNKTNRNLYGFGCGNCGRNSRGCGNGCSNNWAACNNGCRCSCRQSCFIAEESNCGCQNTLVVDACLGFLGGCGYSNCNSGCAQKSCVIVNNCGC